MKIIALFTALASATPAAASCVTVPVGGALFTNCTDGASYAARTYGRPGSRTTTIQGFEADGTPTHGEIQESGDQTFFAGPMFEGGE